MVFHGRVIGVYSSWEACNEQVSGYKNNNHKWFKSRQEAEDAYSKFVQKQVCNSVEVGKMDRQFGLKNFIFV